MKDHRDQNPDLYREKSILYKANNPEKVKLTLKAWRDKNPHRNKEYSSKRKGRKLAQLGVVSRGISLRLLASQEYRCAACEADIRTPQSYHLDHIIPLSRGGMHEDSNLQCLCPHCNLSKGAKLPDEWDAAPVA